MLATYGLLTRNSRKWSWIWRIRKTRSISGMPPPETASNRTSRLFNKLDRWLRVARKLLSIASMTERFLASIERLISLLTWWMPQS